MNCVKRSRESLKYTLDHGHVPVLEVELGESFTVETEDAASGRLPPPGGRCTLLDAWYLKHSPSMANPVTGPIFVRGVEPGDTLVVEIERLELDSEGEALPGAQPTFGPSCQMCQRASSLPMAKSSRRLS